MSPSDTCSRSSRVSRPHGARAAARALTVVAAIALALAGAARARVLIASDEALRLAFPGCQVQRTTAFLSAAQQKRASELAGEAIATGVVTPYRATCAGKP